MRGSAGVSVAAASHWLGGQNQERTGPASLLPRPTLSGCRSHCCSSPATHRPQVCRGPARGGGITRSPGTP
ncbi:hypothetical protein E2C01_099660 [Portunus trituberculatus]|uniref:Uncharacterized protein n=1 Tax=Portunus trituberculatus TaxID=210409 RepID=A0A5B7KHE5_PORTR|nr:hypothetical protein [Portunus trituberculatus]